MLFATRVRHHKNGSQLCGKQFSRSHAGNRLRGSILSRNSPVAHIGNRHRNEERERIKYIIDTTEIPPDAEITTSRRSTKILARKISQRRDEKYFV